MTGNDAVALQHLGAQEQLVKLHIAVAVNAGIGSDSALIAADKFIYDPFSEIFLEIENIVRHTEPPRYAAGVLHIVQRAAGMTFLYACVLVIVKLHCAADALIALLLSKQSGYAGIHSAAHGNQCFFHYSISFEVSF